MNQSKVTVRYAKALFELAKEKSVLKEIRQDIQGILDVFSTSPEFNTLLSSPIYTAAQKKEVLTASLGKRVNSLTASFLNLLVDNKREPYLHKIALRFNDLVQEDLGIQPVHIKSAAALSTSAEQALVDAVKAVYNKTVELTTELDDSLIGGFVLRVEDKQLDASVANQLRQFKRELTDSK